jgi:hypothetical protein
VLEHVLGDKEVDRVIRQGQAFDVLAADAVFDLTERHIREIVGSGVMPTFL